MRLDGRVAVVTGSSSGIGRAIAEVYARYGARVVINSRSAGPAREVAGEFVASGWQAVPAAGDVGDPVQAEAIVRAAVEAWGRVDVLVNNAGVTKIAPSEELPVEEWQRVIATDLSGAFYCARAAAKVMIPQRRGVIINIGSILSHMGIPGRAAYAAAKHGLAGLTKVLAVEWAAHNIRVVNLDPGYIYTRATERNVAAGGFKIENIEGRTPMRRFGLVEEVAQAALFLASDAAGYITGCSLIIDGGWTAYGGW
ncbi:MAG: 3-oxoacyl-ACP reductase FabG [Armatimonadetes bacterium]|nr:3-oxoacyl-ACP reductase FabG [Armatimonadota bacterium]